MGTDHVRAFDGKTRLPDVARVEEVLEEVGLAELVEDPDFFLGGKAHTIARGFHPFLEPEPLARVLEVHVFHAHRAAVRLAKRRQDILEAGLSPEQCVRGEKPPLQVGFGQAEGGRVQQRVAVRALCQRIEAGQQVADIPVAVDEFLDTALPQQLRPVAKTRAPPVRGYRQLEALEKQLPIAPDAVRVRFPAPVP